MMTKNTAMVMEKLHEIFAGREFTIEEIDRYCQAHRNDCYITGKTFLRYANLVKTEHCDKVYYDEYEIEYYDDWREPEYDPETEMYCVCYYYDTYHYAD